MKQINITKATVKEALAQIDTLNELSPKNKNCLRLLADEMYSMCKELLCVTTLDFSITCEGEHYTLHALTKTRVDEDAKKEFLSMSSDGKNSANKGVKGILNAVLEALSYGDDPAMYSLDWNRGIQLMGGDFDYQWTLSQYMESANKETVENEWDGIEKSIIANFADDIAIGVRSGMLEMTVTKSF